MIPTTDNDIFSWLQANTRAGFITTSKAVQHWLLAGAQQKSLEEALDRLSERGLLTWDDRGITIKT